MAYTAKRIHNKNMENIDMMLDGDILTIKIDLSVEIRDSNSGKTIVVATTAGGKKIKKDPDIFCGINVYKRK